MKSVFLTDSQLAEEFAARPGLIPVSIDCLSDEPRADRVIWLDLEKYHFYEGFFSQSISTCAALSGAPLTCFETTVDTLSALDSVDSLAPTGFIFHVGRCGSTLLAKVLARSRANLVFSEAAPHNQVWKAFERRGRPDIELYRRLVLAMGRRRLESYRSHLIKFSSWNLMRFEFIRAAFPDTPALFLFRHPDAVLDSSARERQPWLGMDLGLGEIWTDAGSALGDTCKAALAIEDRGFRRLDYPKISPANLPAIIEFLRCPPSSSREIALMASEFQWNAKSGRTPRRFAARDAATIRADSCLVALYEKLLERSADDWISAPA